MGTARSLTSSTCTLINGSDCMTNDAVACQSGDEVDVYCASDTDCDGYGAKCMVDSFDTLAGSENRKVCIKLTGEKVRLYYKCTSSLVQGDDGAWTTQCRCWAVGASGLTTDEAECVSSAEKTAAESLEALMMLSAISLGRGGAASRVLACPKLKFEWESMRAVRHHEPLNCSCR